MKILVGSLILLFTLSVFAAITPSNCTIEARGWVMDVDMSNSDAGGDFSLGFATNNSGVSKVVLTVSSPGYDDTGTLTTISRTVYGTKQLRKPYPDNATADIVISGSTATVKFILSDYVFSGDTVTCSIAANTYSNNVVQTGLSVTVNSTATHPKCIAAWAWPGFQCVQSNSMVLRAVAFHRSGQNGRPVRVVKFTATDQHSHTDTKYVTVPTIDRTIPDAVLVTEYIATMDISTFTALDLIRCDFAVYPWIGDSGAVLDTSDGINLGLVANYGPITNVCDRSLTYGSSFAVVSLTNNAGANGVVSRTFNAGSPPLAFDTIAHAYSAMVSSNTFGSPWPARADAGGGIIYLREGNYDWVGTGTPSGNIPATWVTYTAFPGTFRTNAWINGQSGANIAKGREHFYNLYLSNSAAVLVYGPAATSASWLDQCHIYLTGSDPISTRVYYVTDCLVDRFAQGFRIVAGDVNSPALVRGNVLHQISPGVSHLFTVIGNHRYAVPEITEGSVVWIDSAASFPDKAPQYPILAFNKLMNVSLGTLLSMVNVSNWNGLAIVQNVLEQTTNTVGVLLGSIVEVDNKNCTNLISWNNTVAGQRWNYAYNSAGVINPFLERFSFKNNLFDSIANKSDVFSPPGADRTNNWPEVFGVGSAGNFIAGISNVGTTSFPFEFAGLNSYQMTSANGNARDFVQYVNPLCFNGVNSRAGNGNYMLRSSSPAYQVTPDQLLPYDIEGRPRSSKDAPGAYAYQPETILIAGATTFLIPGAATQLQP